ncbi:hypothetical protein CO172_01725 [Candidatus Uhrbacteria bacterium CG_4_9_14_3_um_filter_36_7]|uniref:Peptidase S8/S53 domain-containing protein n=1 Tax=Candidatus Uhrbacteria bacterium CG_4_9_14_3_um_filter_36_7 TaxID=1975033 RepID=A0A2M7XHR4_9BACT|nr:MAG: hypothetical protein CO172_01725 [Candidatus Uhrbacteria bacterium CG_4_9_14_3_um_filter_36_7]
MSRFFHVILFFILFPAQAIAITPNDPHFLDQWYLEKIRAPQAWEITKGSRDIIVAIIDTGVDLNHPDLQKQLWINTNEILYDGIDNDQNGYVDDFYGWDFLENDGFPDALEHESYDPEAVSHGTLVAGMIGAVTNNLSSVAGLNWNVRLMPIRILDELGSGDSRYAALAIDYAIANGARIINLSFTGTSVDPAFFEAIHRAYEKGVLVVAAVGNSHGGININKYPIYPACIVEENGTDPVLGVAATDQNDTRADFSNYGSLCTDLSAPGVDIYGLSYHEASSVDFYNLDGGYWEGTSMATPLVAGAAALVLSRFPELTPSDLLLILKLSADPLKEQGTQATGQLGAGRLNIEKALLLAQQFTPTEFESKNELLQPTSSWLVVSKDQGSIPLVRRYTYSGVKLNEFYAYDQAFLGGVRLAVGDVNGDGQEEIITVPGKGGGPQVRIFTKEGKVISQFFAGLETDRIGLFVSVADVDGDGQKEILVASDIGGNGEIKTYTWQGELIDRFFPFGNTYESIHLTSADIDADQKDEIIVLTKVPKQNFLMVRVFASTGLIKYEFVIAHTGQTNPFINAGDLNGDGNMEIILGMNSGLKPEIRIFSQDGQILQSFLAYNEGFNGGVRVFARDLNQDGIDEIWTGAGPSGGPHVRSFNLQAEDIGGFFAFEEDQRHGINLAGN